MATSEIKIYKTNIIPQRNCIVDNIQSYLAGCAVTFSDNKFKYQKIELDIMITIQSTQSAASINDIGNYVDIYQDFKHFYYFVVDANWNSVGTVQLQLSIDSLNTFNGDYTFSNKTNIIRQHKDQYYSDTVSKFTPNTTIHLHKKIDETSEGITGTAVKRETPSAVNQASAFASQKWYLVYETETDEKNTPIRVSLYPETATPYESASSRYVNWYWDNILTSKTYVVYKRQQPDFEFNLAGHHFVFDASTYAVGIERTSYHTISEDHEWIKVYTYNNLYEKSVSPLYQEDGLDDEFIEFVMAEDCYVVDTTSATQVDPLAIIGFWPTKTINASVHAKRFLEPVSSIDRSLSTIIQIVELPYLPDGTLTWSGDDLNYDSAVWSLPDTGILKLKDYTAEFENKIRNVSLSSILTDTFTTTSETAFKTITRSVLENDMNVKDSKFLHSDLFTYKLGYDIENIPIKLEKLDYNSEGTMPSYDISFKPSNTLSNQFGFKIDIKNGTYRPDTDFFNYMISTKDTKLTLYNSSWLDYTRTGRAQDIWANAVSTATTVGSAAAGTLSTVSILKAGSAGAGNALTSIAKASTVASIVTTVASGVASAINVWVNQNSKEKQLKAQAAAINGNSSVDLFDWYGGNKLYIYQYNVPDYLKDKVADLFYYCGYAVDKQGVPDTTSRYWFNFVQCNPVFDEYNEVYDNFQNDIKARWANGVTIYHNNNNSYDWSQHYANWQTNLF